MEKITLEQIDLLMERANVSYTEAKEALEQANGDIVEALLYLEKNNKVNIKTTKSTPNKSAEYKEKAKSFWNQLQATSVIMKKNERTFLNVPAGIAIIGIVVCMPFSFLVLLIAILYGVKINVVGENDVANKVNSTLDSIQK